MIGIFLKKKLVGIAQTCGITVYIVINQKHINHCPLIHPSTATHTHTHITIFCFICKTVSSAWSSSASGYNLWAHER